LAATKFLRHRERHELLDILWPDTNVGDASLTSIIWAVRRTERNEAMDRDAYAQKGEWHEALVSWKRAGFGTHDGDTATVERLWRGRLHSLMDRIEDGEFVPAMDVARAHVRLGNIEGILEWLTRALHEPSRLVLEAPVDPLFDPFRRDPRFDPIMAALPNGHVGRAAVRILAG